MSKKNMGFSLIELLVVIAIIGILATVIIINLSNAKAKTNYSKISADIAEIVQAARVYESTEEVYPDDGAGLGTADPFGTGTNASFGSFPNIESYPDSPCDGYGYYFYNEGNSNANVGVMYFERDIARPLAFLYGTKIKGNSVTAYGSAIDIKDVPNKRIRCTETNYVAP